MTKYPWTPSGSASYLKMECYEIEKWSGTGVDMHMLMIYDYSIIYIFNRLKMWIVVLISECSL